MSWISMCFITAIADYLLSVCRLLVDCVWDNYVHMCFLEYDWNYKHCCVEILSISNSSLL